MDLVEKPNIVIIVSDAMRAQNLQPYGYNLETTPFLNKFSREGVLFENAYATVDQTDPSFTTILSGRYPLVHGITRHGPDVTREHVDIFYATGTRLLQEFLQKQGYTTIAIDWLSRWHKKGFTIYGSALELKGSLSKIWFSKAVSLTTKILIRASSWRTYKSLYKLFSKIGYCYDKSALCVFDVAWNYIKRVRKPFFMLIHLWDTHTPLNDIPLFLVKKFYSGECSETVHEMALRIKNREWRRLVLKYHLKGIKCVDEVEPRYNAAIRHVDTLIKEFIEALKELKIFENTLVIITGDHGDNLIRNNIFIGHGGLFQRVLRIPLVIVGPSIPSNKRIKTPVQHIDIVPTILDIVGVKPKGYYFDGKSLLELLETGNPLRDYVFAVSSTAPKRYALISDYYKLVYSPSIRDAMDKYGGIWFQDVVELYNLRTDNDDRINLVDDLPDIAKELENRLKQIVNRLVKIRLKLMITHRVHIGSKKSG